MWGNKNWRTLNLILRPHQRETIERLAKLHDRSLSYTVRELIEDGLMLAERRERPAGEHEQRVV